MSVSCSVSCTVIAAYRPLLITQCLFNFDFIVTFTCDPVYKIKCQKDVLFDKILLDWNFLLYFFKTWKQYYYFINLFKLNQKAKTKILYNSHEVQLNIKFLTLIPCYFIICFERVNKVIKKFTFQDKQSTYKDLMWTIVTVCEFPVLWQRE